MKCQQHPAHRWAEKDPDRGLCGGEHPQARLRVAVMPAQAGLLRVAMEVTLTMAKEQANGSVELLGGCGA